MKIKNFSGGFFEIGKQQGKIYSEKGMSFANIKINNLLYKNQLKMYKKYYPELLIELEGIAEGGKFDKDKVIYSFICGELLESVSDLKTKKSCTIFGIENDNGVFVGRNYDWNPATEKFFKVYKFINPKRNSFVAVSDMGVDPDLLVDETKLFYNADDAINDKGLFIGLTFAYNDKWSYGLSCIHIIKLVAETCSTVEDAIKVFEKVPICYPKNFFIADREGNIVIVEHTSKKFKIIRPTKGLIVKSNHYLDSELANGDTVLKEDPEHNTFVRHNEVLNKLKKRRDSFNFLNIIDILGDTKSYVCQNNPKIKTVWSIALDMKKQNYTIYWNLFGKRKEKILNVNF